MSTVDKIIVKCDDNYAANKNDCVDFAAAVLQFFFTAPDFDGNVLADDVGALLKGGSAGWTLTTKIAEAITRAKAGDFVIAGMTSAELGDAHGHLAIVVGDSGVNSGGVIVPVGYAGSVGGFFIHRESLSKTFKASLVRTEKINYYYKTPDTEPAASPLAMLELSRRRRANFRAGLVALDPPPPAMAWGKHVSAAFRQKVHDIAIALATEADYLMACMAFESGETFDPAVRNPRSKAVGLIQFTEATAHSLGTTTDALATLSAEQQLDYVKAYFAPQSGKLKNLGDVYMAILWPKAVGKGDDFALFAKPTIQYEQNKGLDLNQDGIVTRHEAQALVESKLAKGMKKGHFG